MLEAGSKAKDWLFFEEMLWMPWRKNHGWLRWLERVEKEDEEIMECHSLHTVEALIRMGIGRRDRIIVEYWGRESFSLLLGRVLTLSINSLLLPLSISISASHLCFVGTIDTNCITVIPSPSESSNTNTTESSSSNTPPSTT